MTKPKKPSPGSRAKKAPASDKASAGDAAAPAGYAVLARKYRPQTFDDLIGQEAMVQTLRNAFASGRIAQAYMLTGVRGVGKTTTARILARALNYEAPGVEGPSLDMDVLGPHCAAIMESRHVDVLEMDAASHTGIDDVREIIESARYSPVSARTKVYIIDEVHMLSKAAFNGLLKTLEEPPEHVKFIFATTEVRKVPVTVLSRCQRFDLRRVEVEALQAHLAGVAEKEQVTIDGDALALIARAAEGSVRDGLSILDQAIAHGDGAVTGAHVRAMLGLADRGRVFDLLETVLKGDAKGALEGLRALYDDGAAPVQVLTDLGEAVHLVTRIAAAGVEAADPTLSEAERDRAADLAGRLDMPALALAWQMLLKGSAEAQSAARPLSAAEMVLVRMCYLAEAPTPEELARQIGDTTQPAAADAASPTPSGNGGATGVQARTPTASRGSAVRAQVAEAVPDVTEAPDPLPLPDSLEAVVALVEQRREVRLAKAIVEGVRLVAFAAPKIEIGLAEGAPATLANDMREFLSRETGRPWMVAVSSQTGDKTLGQKRREAEAAAEAERQRELEAIKGHPAVQAALDYFPDAEITDVRPLNESGDGEKDQRDSEG